MSKNATTSYRNTHLRHPFDYSTHKKMCDCEWDTYWCEDEKRNIRYIKERCKDWNTCNHKDARHAYTPIDTRPGAPAHGGNGNK